MIPDNNKKEVPTNNQRSNLSRDDQDIFNELDYEDKKRHMPYDPYKRTWDEA